MRNFVRLALLIPALASGQAVFAQAQEGAGHEYDGVKLDSAGDAAKGRVPATLTIDPAKVEGSYGPRFFGLNVDNYADDAEKLCSVVPGEAYPRTDPEWPKVAKGLKLPLCRLYFHDDKWKDSCGPLAGRKPFLKASWDKKPSIQVCGPAEFIKLARQVDPEAGFAIIVEITEKTRDQVPEIAQFLMGGAATKWGGLRVEGGAPEPVVPVLWELGNERDWSSNKLTPQEYVKLAKDVVAAIRKEQPGAKIAAGGATAPWHKTQKDKWKDWNRIVLDALGKDVDYLTIHPYYHGYPVSLLEKYLDAFDEQMAASPNPAMKLYVSEHGKWPAQKEGEPWSKTWYTTHSLSGCLSVAEWIARMMDRKDVGVMSMHALTSGPWGMFYREKASGKLYATGLLELFKLYFSIPDGSIVASHMDGVETDVRDGKLALSSFSVKSGDRLYTLVVNRNPSAERALEIKFAEGSWALSGGSLLTAPSVDSVNTPSAKPIMAQPLKASPGALKTFVVPPKSVVLLELTRIYTN